MAISANLATIGICEQTIASCQGPASRNGIATLLATKGVMPDNGGIGNQWFVDRAGIHARITAGFASLANVAVGTGFSSCSASIFEVSTRPDMAAEVFTVAGFHTFSKQVSQSMQIRAAITSTNKGP